MLLTIGSYANGRHKNLQIHVHMVIVIEFRTPRFIFSSKTFVIRAGIKIILVSISNIEDPDQTTYSALFAGSKCSKLQEFYSFSLISNTSCLSCYRNLSSRECFLRLAVTRMLACI